MRKKKEIILDPIFAIFKVHKNHKIGHYDTRIFAIRSGIEAIEVLKRNMYGWNPC